MHFDEKVHKKLVQIGKNLNLRTHLVSKSKTEMALCGDIEVHKISENNEEVFYVLDLARVFPPVKSTCDIPGGIFYQMFRPELLKEFTSFHNILLSSDSLSNWQQFDPKAEEMENDVRKATKYVEQEVEKYAFELSDENVNKYIIDVSIRTAKSASFTSLLHCEIITRELHKRGINTRYMGLLMIKMDGKNERMTQFLANTMVSRSLKNMWRSQMRKSKEKGQRIHQVCLDLTTRYLQEITNLKNIKTREKILEKNKKINFQYVWDWHSRKKKK